MAFSGIHVEFSYQADASEGPSDTLSAPSVSENITAAGASTIVAPASNNGRPIATINAVADTWVSFGAAPADPLQAATPRALVLAGKSRSFFVAPGSKVRWAAVA